jgi:hypothetical protein
LQDTRLGLRGGRVFFVILQLPHQETSINDFLCIRAKRLHPWIVSKPADVFAHIPTVANTYILKDLLHFDKPLCRFKMSYWFFEAFTKIVATDQLHHT